MDSVDFDLRRSDHRTWNERKRKDPRNGTKRTRQLCKQDSCPALAQVNKRCNGYCQKCAAKNGYQYVRSEESAAKRVSKKADGKLKAVEERSRNRAVVPKGSASPGTLTTRRAKPKENQPTPEKQKMVDCMMQMAKKEKPPSDSDADSEFLDVAERSSRVTARWVAVAPKKAEGKTPKATAAKATELKVTVTPTQKEATGQTSEEIFGRKRWPGNVRILSDAAHAKTTRRCPKRDQCGLRKDQNNCHKRLHTMDPQTWAGRMAEKWDLEQGSLDFCAEADRVQDTRYDFSSP